MLFDRLKALMSFAVALVVALAACSGSGNAGEQAGEGSDKRVAGADLDGTQWMLVSLNGNSLVEGTRITLSFSDGFVEGFAGCNRYSRLIVGQDGNTYMYEATDDGSLKIPGFVITEKDCPTPEGVAQQEAAYTNAVRNTASYSIDGSQLSLKTHDGRVLIFSAQE